MPPAYARAWNCVWQEGEGPEIDMATGLPVARPAVPQYGDADYGQQGTKAEFIADVPPTPPAECPFNADGSPRTEVGDVGPPAPLPPVASTAPAVRALPDLGGLAPPPTRALPNLGGLTPPAPPPPPPPPSPKPCATPIDFILVLDESGSMKKPTPIGSMEGPGGLKALAKLLVSQFALGVNAARFSVVSFATNATTRVSWSYDYASINAGID